MLARLKALTLLTECVGDELWSVSLCREKGIPEAWIEELADCYESGYRSDRERIYYHRQPVNQYHGVRDVDLACKLAEFLGVDTTQATSLVLGKTAVVRALRDAVDEL